MVRIEAEFGPSPYMPALPHTQMPLADLDAAVEFVGRRELARLQGGACDGVTPSYAATPEL